MPIIDCQVHAYEANTPKRPWHDVPNWPAHVTGDEMVAAMDKVGVDGAIFISAFGLYRFDASYAVEVQKAHPDRFAIVKPVDPDDPAVADVIADWKKTPGAVGVRIMLPKEFGAVGGRSWAWPDPARGGGRGFSGQHFVLGQSGRRDRADRPISQHALHHRSSGDFAAARAARSAGTMGPFAEGTGTGETVERGDQGERRVHAVTAAVSVPGYLGSAGAGVRCLGFDRCLWGTDWTRAYAVVNFEQAVEPFLHTDRLNETERAMLMGGACAKVYGWSPKHAA